MCNLSRVRICDRLETHAGIQEKCGEVFSIVEDLFGSIKIIRESCQRRTRYRMKFWQVDETFPRPNATLLFESSACQHCTLTVINKPPPLNDKYKREMFERI